MAVRATANGYQDPVAAADPRVYSGITQARLTVKGKLIITAKKSLDISMEEDGIDAEIWLDALKNSVGAADIARRSPFKHSDADESA